MEMNENTEGAEAVVWRYNKERNRM